MLEATETPTSWQASYERVDALDIAVNWMPQPRTPQRKNRVPTASPSRRKPSTASGEAGTQSRRGSDVVRKRRPSGVDVPVDVLRRFVKSLADGDHEFAVLRESFTHWLAAVDVAPVSDVMLAKWLKGAGLVKRRVGREKVTVYRKGDAK